MKDRAILTDIVAVNLAVSALPYPAFHPSLKGKINVIVSEFLPLKREKHELIHYRGAADQGIGRINIDFKGRDQGLSLIHI